jgi:hypothetical protein
MGNKHQQIMSYGQTRAILTGSTVSIFRGADGFDLTSIEELSILEDE